MAKQDIQTIIGSSISKDEALLKNFKSIKSCFVGWVESYNETSGTVNVQPAIQDYIPNDERSGKNYRNSPLLVNVWVYGTFKSTAIEKGDKAVCFVLDQKANDFFKCIYDSGISLAFQTFKPKTSAQKSVCDCVCVILGDASFQEVYKAISTIDTALENKADIDGTYPNMTVGNATNADSATKATQDGDGNNIPSTYAKQTGTYPNMTVGNATNVTESINGNPITNIFENDGTTVKKATQAIEDENGNNIFGTYLQKPITLYQYNDPNKSFGFTNGIQSGQLLSINGNFDDYSYFVCVFRLPADRGCCILSTFDFGDGFENSSWDLSNSETTQVRCNAQPSTGKIIFSFRFERVTSFTSSTLVTDPNYVITKIDGIKK